MAPGSEPGAQPRQLVATAANMPSADTWLRDLGLTFDAVSGAHVTARLTLGSHQHRMPWGVVHGGVSGTVIESVASVGASAAVFDLGQFAVAVNNSTDFVQSMRTGQVDVAA